jgi:N-ethylmaleimide reductase
MNSLWESVPVGSMSLQNRLAMGPMTRSRASLAGVLGELNATYYAQRASSGLIISEGTQPSDDGQGYMLTPGIYTEDQISGWRLVAERVHAAGGLLYVQIMHVGRISHPANTLHGQQPVAPSAVRPAGTMFTPQGLQEMPEPRALTAGEIEATVRDFRWAAKCAIEAGVDGVEIHGANGYLIDQFLSENANLRTDEYGGSMENRVRFAVEVATAIADEIGADRTGFHISPGNPFNDIVEGDTATLYRTLVPKLGELNLAYLHTVQGQDEALLAWFRSAWPTALIVNRPNRPRESIAIDIESGMADVASVARFALANPDLPARLKTDAALNEADPSTFYGGGAHGYTDYPTLA